MLATNDSQVRRLNGDLANVSVQLDGERDDLAAALKNLAVALSEVSWVVVRQPGRPHHQPQPALRRSPARSPRSATRWPRR